MTALTPVALAATGGTPLCVRSDRAAADLRLFLEDALTLLRDTGRDPEAYRLEIRRDFLGTEAPAGSLEPPLVRAVFSPRDAEGDYAVEVRPDRPCGLSWVWNPPRFLPWQREVLERARDIARIQFPESDRLGAVEIVESLDRLGVVLELHGDALPGTELRVLLRKSDLTVVEWRAGEEAR